MHCLVGPETAAAADTAAAPAAATAARRNTPVVVRQATYCGGPFIALIFRDLMDTTCFWQDFFVVAHVQTIKLHTYLMPLRYCHNLRELNVNNNNNNRIMNIMK